MAKRFFDVFPSLKVEGDMKNLLTETEVTKVGMNHERDHLRVYLSSTRLIHKKDIRQLESAIAQQIFKGRMMQVKVIEKYHLSEQYTPEKLLDLYRDSILEELKDYSLMEYNLLRTAKMEFTSESHMLLTLENTIIAQTRSHEIVEFLEKVICERCGLDLAVELAYEEPKESKYKKNSDLQIQFEIKNIMKKVHIRNDDGESVPAVVEGGAEAVSDGTTTSGGTGGNATTNTVSSAKNAAKPAEHAGKTAGNGEKGKKEFKRRFEGGGFKKSDNPDVIYGRDFEDEPIAIEKIVGEMGEVTIRCQVMTLETREIRNEKTIVIMSVTDFTDSIVLKIFTRNDQLQELLDGGLAKGAFLKIKGVTTIDKFDSELTIGSVVGIKKIADFTSTRADTSPEKRVELHCHTKMSDMDGVSDVKDIVKRAMKWGHKAIAITDHGDVQAFPDANHAVPPDSDFKIIYGVEAYLVDDLKDIIVDSKGQSLNDSYVVFDLETTGLSPDKNKIIEIGAVKVVDGAITERFSTFVNPEVPIPYNIEQLTSIKDDMVLDAPRIEEILPEFMKFCEGTVMVAHNAEFDTGFIRKNCERMGLPFDFTIADTVALARILLPQLNRFKLDTVAKAVGVSLDHHHRAVDDAACTAEIFVKFIEMLHERGMETLDDVNQMGATSPELVKKLKSHHAIILATNDIGRINLYRLVSMSHLTYFHKTPRVPKSEFVKYREGLLLGSACEAGELYRAILDGRPEEEIIRLVKFYDYLEIQPIGNNNFMIAKGMAKDEEQLRDWNRDILRLADELGKPCCATGDVHFLEPEDEAFRRILMAGQGFSDADNQAPLYFKSTDEMLKEFSYLGEDRAYEVVVKNTNMIADMCDVIRPVPRENYPPHIDGCEDDLRNMCYEKAKRIYGDPLPEPVQARLDRELNSIIGNGYAVMYIIAQKLVTKSLADGYLVGSRGSVGSSLAAFMSDITEVNSLAPHYLCPDDKYLEWHEEYSCGVDLPDKICPNCGKPLTKQGFNIPFETFLGFEGDKVPDIDLNFAGEYQSRIHWYTGEIFGHDHVFRAGTIGTVAEKTAFGYVKKYMEERGIECSRAEENRLAAGCTGVRRTSGQHPGGVVVVPKEIEIYDVCPIQHPADDPDSDIITTHFEYHSIDANLLKLDELGHDDPTIIKHLENLTGVNAQEIPLDDPETMSLFHSCKALKYKGENPDTDPILGDLGCVAVPEFGTKFVRGMVKETHPSTFAELVSISGLSHGTDVWLGNAAELVRKGIPLSGCICCRDDIMNYLILQGVKPKLSFKTMESVRKGKGLKPEYEADMREHNVPDWYIASCKKIKYMFPKAHAAAYVMMALRVAYYKVYYPQAYYAAYFAIRAKAFNYELMCQGKERCEYYLDNLMRKKENNETSKKDEDTIGDLKVVQEMYARGYEFEPIDLYRAKAKEFQVIDGKVMPSFSAIEGMGDKAAEMLEAAAKDGKFLSKDDLRERAKVSKTVVETMSDLGLLDGMPEGNQLSIFDL